jgi:hypothetical protein
MMPPVPGPFAGKGGDMGTAGQGRSARKVRGVGKAGWAGVLALAALALPCQSARAAEHYYVIIFAAQADPPLPRYAHTFATFVRAAGSSPACCAVEAHTISWLPASGEIRTFRFFPERGANLDLAGSLRFARSLGARVSRWGPFEVRPELYARAQAEIALLSTGVVEYKVLDRGLRPRVATNCIHAASDIDVDDGLLETGVAYGEEASYLVAWHYRRWMIEPERVHEWVLERVGLCGAPIEPRNWGRAPAPP